MKVLLVSGIFPPDIGGPATFVPKLADYLISKNHQVQVLTLSDSKINMTSELFDVKRVNRNLPRPIRSLLIIWEVLKTPKDYRILAAGLHEEVGLSLLFKRHRAVAKIVGDPVWERSRNNNETNLGLNNFNNSHLRMSRRFQRFLLSFALRRYEIVTCPSLELCELVNNWGIDRPVRFIANGTDVSISHFGGEKIYDLVCVSRLVSWKNIDVHIEIASALGLRLGIIGSGPEEDNLRKLSETNGCNVDFFGELTKPEIAKVLQKSKVYILLSEYEGLSYSLLEALAAGLPAVVSDIEANTQVVRNRIEGVVVNLEDWKESLSHLQEIFYDRSTYSKYSRNAQLRVFDQFEIKKQLAKIESLLQ